MSTSAPAGESKTFADFGVEASICDSLAEVGIIHPFPIQELTLPLALTGADIIGQARTGTGKTLGFGLPMIQRVDLDQDGDAALQALVIVPTRELCMQVAEDLSQAGRKRGVKVVAVYGGKSMQPQIDALEDGAHIVVGTPGRLLDLSRRGHLNLSSCAGLVLDEADEMLDLGFLPDVEALIEQCADERQTLLFSATMPAQIVGLARRYMRKPTFMRAEVEEVQIGPQTRQFFFSCHRMDKPAVLARILQTPDRGLCVVFCRTKRMADQLAEELRQRDVSAQAIHSDLRQEARERALQKFREGKTTVLCATEVAARGLDIDDVTHVVNYDCPDDEKMYLHRIGRTGRAGADGVAITFAVWNELPRLEMIRRELDIEEEVHEVFSTSPLLEELFDLPVRQEKKKVASPPKARTGKASRSRRRQESGGRRSSRDDAAESDGKAREDDRDSDTARSRRQGGDAGKKAAGRKQSAEAEPESRSSGKGGRGSSDDDGEQTRTRRRTRRRTRSGGSDEKAATGEERGGTSKDSTSADSPGDEQGRRRGNGSSRAGSGGDASSGASRTRSRGRRDTAEDASDAGASDARAKDSRDGAGRGTDAGDKGARDGAGRSRDGGDRDRRDKDGRSKDSRSKDSSGKDGGSKDGGGKDGGSKEGGNSGRSRSDQRSGRGTRSDGRRGRDSSRGSGRQSTRGSSRDRTKAREQISAAAARGEGQPRLNRRMEVVHLP